MIISEKDTPHPCPTRETCIGYSGRGRLSHLYPTCVQIPVPRHFPTLLKKNTCTWVLDPGTPSGASHHPTRTPLGEFWAPAQLVAGNPQIAPLQDCGKTVQCILQMWGCRVVGLQVPGQDFTVLCILQLPPSSSPGSHFNSRQKQPGTRLSSVGADLLHKFVSFRYPALFLFL